MADVPSALMRQTLLDRDLVRSVDNPVRRILPWLDVVVLGGHSIFDRGRDAVLPVADELRELLPEHRMLILTGAGIRGRHVMSVGYDLGLPTGVVASLAGTEAEQNGHLFAALLAADGVSAVSHGTVAHQLAGHLSSSPAVVSNGYPPYGLQEFPPAEGALPVHRTDAGAFLLADAYGARNLVYVKAVDTTGPGGLGPEVSAAQLRGLPPEDLPFDALVLDLLKTAKHVTSFRVVNGLVRGEISAALRGEQVGTLVTA